MNPEIIKIQSGEQLRNEIIENAIIQVYGSNVKLGVLHLIDSRLELYQTTGLRAENIKMVGGVPWQDEAILVNGMVDGRFTDIDCEQVQRSFNVHMDKHGPTCEIVVDGLRVSGHVQHYPDPNRREAFLVHGYRNAYNAIIDAQLRNITVAENWPASSITFWDCQIKRALIKESPHMQGPVQVGGGGVKQGIERLEIKDVNATHTNLLWRTYVDSVHPLTRDAVGRVDLPDGWRHKLMLGGGANPKTIGVYDTIEELKAQLPEAA